MSEEEYPCCVFFPEKKCSVRHYIQASGKLDKIMEPFIPKVDDRVVAAQIGKDMMEGMFKASGMEWATLAGFCHVCPKLRELPTVEPPGEG